ncbi:MAG: cell division protein SepF [Clostridiales bacterium]|nr:cell division protein SepF [Clostridiales bacterium]
MGKFSDFMKKLYDYEEVDDVNEYNTYGMDEYDESGESEYETSYDSFQEEVPYTQPETQTYIQQPVATTTPVRSSTATVVMLSPYDIRTSQIVCDHIREGHIVICNLTPNANNQRVVDYISGAVYSLDGKIEPTPVKTTFVCTPKMVELIVENQAGEEGASKVSAL